MVTCSVKYEPHLSDKARSSDASRFSITKIRYAYFTIKLEGAALRQTRPSDCGPRAKIIAHPCCKPINRYSRHNWRHIKF